MNGLSSFICDENKEWDYEAWSSSIKNVLQVPEMATSSYNSMATSSIPVYQCIYWYSILWSDTDKLQQGRSWQPGGQLIISDHVPPLVGAIFCFPIVRLENDTYWGWLKPSWWAYPLFRNEGLHTFRQVLCHCCFLVHCFATVSWFDYLQAGSSAVLLRHSSVLNDHSGWQIIRRH